jgi:SAM-dependent methyltransferase
VGFPFEAGHFQRIDPSDDAEFYEYERLVTHIDDAAVETLGKVYAELIPRPTTVLDLMSSWVSHFQSGMQPYRLIGLGMNAAELRANPQLSGWLRHDLNRSGAIPFRDEAFDAVTCAVSVQYLTRPLAIFSEMWRVLRPGGVAVISFSNRCFPSKAVWLWSRTTDDQHVTVVREYFEQSGDWSEIRGGIANPGVRGDPLYVVWARKER